MSGENAGGFLSEYDVRLVQVAALSDEDVWAVGSKIQTLNVPNFGGSPEHELALLLHWDGGNWNQVSIPDVQGLRRLSFTTAEAIGEDNVLVGGQYEDAGGAHALFLLWDDGKWLRLSLPHVNNTSNVVRALAGTSKDDLWAIGSFVLSAGATPQQLIHWDGNQWTTVDTGIVATKPREEITLHDAAILSKDDMWFVGYRQTTQGYFTMSIHWDGSNWTEVSLPKPHPNDTRSRLTSVAAVSKDDIWATGTKEDSNHMLSYHWNGKEWLIVDAPRYERDLLQAVAARTGNQGSRAQAQVWAVGQFGGKMDPATNLIPTYPLLMHWEENEYNEHKWNVALSLEEWSEGVLNDVTILPNGNVWAVGHYSEPKAPGRWYDRRTKALVVEYRPQGCQP
jgi:hypothetical protein